MRKLFLYAIPVGLVISLITLLNNNSYSQQTSQVKTTISSTQSSQASVNKSYKQNTDDDFEDDNDNDSNIMSSENTDINRSNVTINTVDRKQPHVLKINSSNAKLQGEIKINGKVVKRLNRNQSEINLTPYLSRGRQKIEISGRYIPATASVSIEMKSEGSNVSQQTSGSGILNYILDLDVE
jgi:hypothetical protein